MATLQDLLSPLSKDDILASVLDIAGQLGLSTTAWQPGSVVREILEILCQKMSDLTQVISVITSGGLLDYATGDWLALLAKSLYNVSKILATFGSTTVRLTNSSTTNRTITPGVLHALNSATGATYTITTGGSLLASGGTLDVTVIADLSGSGSNAAVGQINALVTPILGVTLTNATPLVATDTQTDDQLRQLCRDKLAAASPNGPKDAYNYFAKTATFPSGVNAGVTRSVVTQGNGSVVVYVASASGGVTGTSGNPATNLGIVNQNIQNSCVATGKTATVVSATELDITVAADIYLKHNSTFTSVQIQNLVLTQLLTYFSSVPIGGFNIGAGGFLFLDAVIGEIFQANPDIIQVVVTNPGADVAMLINNVAVLTSILGSFTVHST